MFLYYNTISMYDPQPMLHVVFRFSTSLIITIIYGFHFLKGALNPVKKALLSYNTFIRIATVY